MYLTFNIFSKKKKRKKIKMEISKTYSCQKLQTIVKLLIFSKRVYMLQTIKGVLF